MFKQRLLSIAETLDAFRVVPRLLLLAYGYVCYGTHTWYTALVNPTMEQGAYAGVIWGAAAVWFKLYVESGRKWNDR